MKYPNKKCILFSSLWTFCVLNSETSTPRFYRPFPRMCFSNISSLWWCAWTILASTPINFTRSPLQVRMVPAPGPITEGHRTWPSLPHSPRCVFDTCVFVLPECVAHLLFPAVSNLDVNFPSLFQFVLFIGKISGYFLDFDCRLMDW